VSELVAEAVQRGRAEDPGDGQRIVLHRFGLEGQIEQYFLEVAGIQRCLDCGPVGG